MYTMILFCQLIEVVQVIHLIRLIGNYLKKVIKYQHVNRWIEG